MTRPFFDRSHRRCRWRSRPTCPRPICAGVLGMTLTTRLTPKSDPNRAIVAPATTDSTVASMFSTPSRSAHHLAEKLRFDRDHDKGRIGRGLGVAVGHLDAVAIFEFETAFGSRVAGDDLPRIDQTLAQQSLDHGLAHHSATDKRQGFVSQCHFASGFVSAKGNTAHSSARASIKPGPRISSRQPMRPASRRSSAFAHRGERDATAIAQLLAQTRPGSRPSSAAISSRTAASRFSRSTTLAGISGSRAALFHSGARSGCAMLQQHRSCPIDGQNEDRAPRTFAEFGRVFRRPSARATRVVLPSTLNGGTSSRCASPSRHPRRGEGTVASRAAQRPHPFDPFEGRGGSVPQGGDGPLPAGESPPPPSPSGRAPGVSLVAARPVARGMPCRRRHRSPETSSGAADPSRHADAVCREPHPAPFRGGPRARSLASPRTWAMIWVSTRPRMRVS